MQSLALVGSVALQATNVFLVTTIMPSVVQDIGGFSYYSMNTTMFVVASIIGAAIAGQMADRIGSKKVYLIALVVFAIASVIAAMAPNMYTLIFARTVEGLAGGTLLSMSYVLIRQVFEERLWSRAIGLVSAMWGIATFSGPAIGGIFSEYGHWRWAFWSMLPVTFLLAIVVIIWLPTTVRDAAPHLRDHDKKNALPVWRLGLLAASVLSISAASVLKTLWQQGVLLALSVALLAWLVSIDRRAPNRLLPSGSYSATAHRAVYITMVLISMASAVEIFTPYFLQNIQGHSPIYAGYITTAMSAGWTLASLAGAGLSKKWRRRSIQAGPILMVGSLFTFAWVIQLQHNVQHGLGLAGFVLNLVLLGLGIGMAWPHLLNMLFRIVPEEDGSIASSSVSTVQQYAIAIGSAVAGLIVNTFTTGSNDSIQDVSRAALWMFTFFGVVVIFAIISARQALNRSDA